MVLSAAGSDISRITMVLENFCKQQLQRTISEFVSTNQGRYQPATADGEQSLDNYAIFEVLCCLCCLYPNPTCPLAGICCISGGRIGQNARE